MNDEHRAADFISPIRLVLSTLGPWILLYLSYNLQLKLEKKLIVGLLRSSLQLLFLGSVLLHFIFSFRSPLLVLCYLLFMIFIASLEAVGRQQKTYDKHFQDSFIACLFGGGFVALYGSLAVFSPIPWWNPQVLVPTSGMIIGNSVSGPAVAVERLLSEVTDKRHEIETRLSFGATAYEAILPMIRNSVQAALTPTLNQMAIMGLVSIPGMMTGQLLGGTKPIIAAEYQIAILYLIVTTSVFSCFISVCLATRNACCNLSSHQCTAPEKVFKREGGKQDIDVMLGKIIFGIYQSLTRCCCGCFKGAGASYETLPTNNVLNNIDSQHGGELDNILSADIATGRATYSIVENSSRKFDDVALVIEKLNIKSGSTLLFCAARESELDDRVGLELTISKGERISLEGISGLGKSRLLRAIAKLDQPVSGNLSYLADRSHANNSSESAVDYNGYNPYWRTKVIYIPQALPAISGSPHSFLLECLSFHSRNKWKIAKDLSTKSDELQGLVKKYCRFLESKLLLREKLLEENWSTLSGGERQRAIIICGFILAILSSQDFDLSGCTPNSDQHSVNLECSDVVILLDEPTAACDAQSCQMVEELIISSGATCIFITHDERQAMRLAHRRILLDSVPAVIDSLKSPLDV